MSEVERLRKSGFKVRVKHYRLMNPYGIKPCGGKTVVEVTGPDGQHFSGMARCSRKENFNKRLGVRIALGRAFKNKGSSMIPEVPCP